MKITIENTPIFVMHCKSLKERRINIDVQMKKYNLMPKLICDWDASELESDIRFLTSFYKYDEQLWNDRIRWQGDFLSRKLKMSEVSLAIKHLQTMRMVIDKNADFALFLEDDVILCDDFREKFNYIFANAPYDFDFIFIGDGCNLHATNIEKDKYFYRKDPPNSRCTDSFLIRRRACEAMLENAIPLALPIDFEINNVAKTCDLITYWVEPTLCTQGSQTGIFPTTIQ